MPEILDDIAYMSQEVGPRPAGTEEEQQTALYIAEQLQKRAGFTTDIEDFACNAQHDIVGVVCFGLAALLSIGALISSVLVIPAFLVTLACAILYILELVGKPVLSRAFQKGVSQNVIAKYSPSQGTGKSPRSRKIVLVSHYDSGKVRAELNGGMFAAYPMLQKACIVALAVIPLLWLVRMAILLNSTGTAAIALKVITVIAVILVLLPVVLFFLHRSADYNEGAVSNASGVAVLLETARRVAAGRMSEEELAQRAGATVHGEDAARAEGLVPEGVPIDYEATSMDAFEAESEGEKLASAKAAVAALTGQAVKEYAPAPADISKKLVQVKEPFSQKPDQQMQAAQREETMQAFTGAVEHPGASQNVTPVVSQEPAAAEGQGAAGDRAGVLPGRAFAAPAESGESTVPDWFKSAQEKANKPSFKPGKPAKRSRYADALDAAVAASSVHFEEANKAIDKETEEHMCNFGGGIEEVQAPAAERPSAAAPLNNKEPIKAMAPSQTPSARPVEQPPVANAQQPAQASAADVQQVRAQQPTQLPMSQPTPQQFAQVTVPQQPAVPQAAAPQQPAAPQVPVPQQPAAAPQASVPQQAATPQASYAQQPVQPAPTVDVGATTAMPPIDVSAYRSKQLDSREAAAKALQDRPSKRIEPAQRISSDRVVFDETNNPEVQSAETYDFSQISAPSPSAPSLREEAGWVQRPTVSAHMTQPAPMQPASIEAPSVSPQPSQVPQSAPAEQPVSTAHPHGKRNISLPDLKEKTPPLISEATKQRAPLAEAETIGGKAAAKSLLSAQIPRIDANGSAEAAPSVPEMSDNKRAALRSTLPSMSGTITAEPETRNENSAVSLTGSFAAIGASSNAFSPVGDELLADVAPDDVYVDDADDSSYDTNVTETGAFAGPGYMEMPETKHGLFGRFHKHKKGKQRQEEQSASDWLQVGDDFNPTDVGAARGGWDSFQNDSDYEQGNNDYVDDDNYDDGFIDDQYLEDDYSDADSPDATVQLPRKGDRWNGGAFSKLRSKVAKNEDYENGYDDYAEDSYDEEGPRGETQPQRLSGRAQAGVRQVVDASEPPYISGQPGAAFGNVAPAEGNLASAPVTNAAAPMGAPASDGAPQQQAGVAQSDQQQLNKELKAVYGFRNPDIDVEVWFVALGSELSGNAGSQAFLREHAAELRGSVIINLESLGAGDLCSVEKEGILQQKSPSSRMKRYLKKASKISGVSASSTQISWRESITSLAMKAGLQGISLVGMDGGKPAMMGQADDVLENVDQQTLMANADFVMGLIKND